MKTIPKPGSPVVTYGWGIEERMTFVGLEDGGETVILEQRGKRYRTTKRRFLKYWVLPPVRTKQQDRNRQR